MAGSTGWAGRAAESKDNQWVRNKDLAPGSEAIKTFAHKLYPSHTNRLQATAIKKFWLGGPDPLDNILIFTHQGNSGTHTPAHFHYVTCGFSDLHGDGRIHQITGPGEQSGFGFELTFRLKRKEGEPAPLWPARMLNSLARYVFKTGNMLNCGDQIPWQQPLDDGDESIVQHMMITEDTELGMLDTPLGNLQFRQVVGITENEMLAAQLWKGKSILELMSKIPETGGGLLVTDMDREYSVSQYNPQLRQSIQDSGERDGSTLGHVTAACFWRGSHPQRAESDDSNDEEEEQIHSQVEITIDADAAKILPRMLRGRLMKGRFFVYQNISNQVMIFVPPEFTADMVIVKPEEPIKSQGQVLQIFCDKHFTEILSKQVAFCESTKEMTKQLPRTLHFQHPNVLLTVVPKGRIPVL